MTVFKRWLYGVLAVAVLTGPAGLLLRRAISQEGHEGARPVVVKEGASEENPFEARGDGEQRERPAVREGERGERPTEQEMLKRQVEVLKIALHALMEAGKKDAAEVVQRAIRAREVTLEERRDDEAHMIRERAPGREQLVEILTVASNCWREFNNQDKAEVVGRLAKELGGAGEREQPRTEARPEEGVRRKLHELEQALVRAREAGREDEAERIRRQMQELTPRREGGPDRQPARVEAPPAAEEVERLKGAVRELNGQVSELRREMAEIRKLLENLAAQKRD